MTTYSVRVPVCGYAIVEVEAESEEEAIDAALQSWEMDDIEEIDAHRQIVRGNVFSGALNRIDAVEMGE